MATLYLGIDVGTTGAKAVLLGSDGVAAETAVGYALASPQPGWAEEDPMVWWEAVRTAVQRVVSQAPRDARIAAVGVCSMVPAIVLTDDAGEPVRPAILQNDGRAARELEAMALDPAEVLRRTGSPPSLQQVGPRMRWLWNHEAGRVATARHLMGGADYIVFRLTGRMAVDRNWAIESGLWDLTREGWATDYLAAGGVRAEWLPPVLAPGEVVGGLPSHVAADLGLAPDTPVLVGSADHIAAALAAGLTAPGDVLIKIGGAGDILAAVPDPRPDPRMFLDQHDIPGLWVVNGCMTASGSLVRWWAGLFAGLGAPPASAVDLRELDAAAEHIPAGSEGLIVLPYFLGEKTPIFDPWARGTMAGLTLSHTAAHIHRAILEAVAYAYRHHIEVLTDMGFHVTQVLVSDGGSKSGLWLRILAAVLDRDITAYPDVGGSALGIAFLAGMRVGGFDAWEAVGRFRGHAVREAPQPDAAVRYREGYRLYRDLYERLRPFYPALGAWAGGEARQESATPAWGRPRGE